MHQIKRFHDPGKRIGLTHALVVIVLALNIFFFTENTMAIALQVLLIIAVVLHHKDDEKLKTALRQAQAHFEQEEQIFDNNIIISEADLDGIITYVNRKFCDISGYSAEELIGHPHNIVRHEQTPSSVFTEMWKTLKRDETWHGTLQNRRKDGTSYWVDSTITPLFQNGRKIGYKSIRFDVTASMQIRTQQLILQKITDAIDDLVLVVENHRNTLANNKMLDFFGLASFHEFSERYPDISRLFMTRHGYIAPTEKWIQAVAENSSVNRISKVLLIHPESAREHIFRIRVYPLASDGSYILLFNDITHYEAERQSYQQNLSKAKSELMQQSTRFEFAINSSRDGFWDYDLINKKFYLSSGWKQRLGFTESEEVTYLDYMKLIHDSAIVNHILVMEEAMGALENQEKCEFVHFRMQYPLRTRNGEELIIEDVGDIYCSGNNEPSRITGFHRDVTDQVRQNRIIESQNRLSAMGEMVSNIAHQWRQPISAINNILNDMEFDIELDDSHEIECSRFLEISEKIKGLTGYLSSTIEDFRSFSSNDKVQERFDPTALIDEVYTIIQSSFAKTGIAFEIDNQLPQMCTYLGYRRELLQVMLNILNNARDILEERQTQNPRVTVAMMQHDDHIAITICDNGGGIPSGVIDKVFEPYFTTKHQSIGTGIGLYMSKKIMTEHFRGDLNVINGEEGACFTLTLPL